MAIKKTILCQPHYRTDGPSNTQILLSKSISPTKLLTIISNDDFEEVTHEWAHGYLGNRYEKICLLGGSGDKGRDIAAYKNFKDEVWDNYQCKHYNHPLSPSDVWVEMGKLCYYCFIKELTIPKKYFFVSPLGVGSKLHDLLKHPQELLDGLKSNWDKHCKKHITSSKDILMEGDFEKYINSFDFTIFEYIDPQEFVEQFKQTPYFYYRFGSMNKPRPIPKLAPEDIQSFESIYIKKLLEAYSDHLKLHLDDVKKLNKYTELKKDFDRQRNYYFCAESLKEFSRDISDPDIKLFDNLKEEIYDGIINTIESDATNGFERLRNVLKRATEIQITNNQLVNDLKIIDRYGICHHLANEKPDVKWKR
ncbi:MAG: ABC-three component system protein [Candidatus Nanoarchaeia archaeon]|jgi:hypothetical protein